MKNKSISISNLVVLIFVAAFMLSSCQSATMRANKQWYLGTKAANEGKLNKAKRKLQSALKLDTGKNQYLVDAAMVSIQLGNKKQAMRYIQQVRCVGDCHTEQSINLLTFKGIYALNLGQRKSAMQNFQQALGLMDLHGVENDTLRSTLYCNMAVAEIFDQGANSDSKDKNNHFKKAHRRDFERAGGYLRQAVLLDSSNCVARFNLQVVEQVLALPTEAATYGYLPDTVYETIQMPIFDCFPEERPDENKISFEEIHSTLKDKEELLLVLDISGSMSATIGQNGNESSRFDLMMNAVEYLLTHLDSTTNVGVITVDGDCSQQPLLSAPVGSFSQAELLAQIKGLPLNGGTPLYDRLVMGTDMFGKKKKDKAILLFSDGIGGCTYENDACALGEMMQRKDIQFYAFSLLLEESASSEYAVYNCIVNATDGLLLGITEKKQVEDKTSFLSKTPYSVPFQGDDIRHGEFTPYARDKSEVLPGMSDEILSNK